MPYHGSELIKSFVPDDSCQQSSSIELVEEFFNLVMLRLGIDFVTLNFTNRLLNKIPLVPILLNWEKQELPINFIIDMIGRITNKSKQEINLLKLLICGQFCFMARK